MQIQYDLRKAGGNCTVPARTCLRISCWNTSGIYVCNVSPKALSRLLSPGAHMPEHKD